MHLNEYGEIAYTQWVKLAERFNNYELDVFQIMPNHMHGIIVLNNPTTAIIVDADNDIKNAAAGAPLAGALSGADLIMGAGVDSIKGAGASPARTGENSGNSGNLGDIVGAYKSIVANECLKIYKSNNERMGKLWQRNYYEIIIRNEKSYARISEYIMNNPAKWDADKFYH
ncbi:transposase [Aequorivita sinensis]|uniref:transposase n=1 Tax=Aequorivita sinensis TaxID=1382458 RepID=UPI00230192D0|nr:transposase [Aequorivita sinensis]